MNYYKSIIQRRKSISPVGSKGTRPSWLMPPKAAWSKVGFQMYEATDLLCEGPIAGLTDQNGVILNSSRVTKDFQSDTNTRGSSTNGIDKGCYFNDTAIRDQTNVSTHSKYDMELRVGDEFQAPPQIMQFPSKMEKVGVPIKGPYDMVGGGDNGARTGNGSRDIRDEGRAGRDFVSWKRFVPREQREKPWTYENYDRNIDQILLTLQIDSLSDTRSKSTKAENKGGKSRMGQPLKLTVTFKIEVGKVNKQGVKTISTSTFQTRAGSGVSRLSGGRLQVTGVITSSYAISLENIYLPKLSETDLYNFIKVSKIEHETFSNIVKRDVAVTTITKINSLRLSYPHTAYLAVALDSKYFPSVPQRTFRVKGKKILIPSNYTPTNPDGSDRRFSVDGSTLGNEIYQGNWDGTFKFGWSDNPAWIYYDLLMNTRYGLGSHLRDVEIIDKWSLYEIGMYCDAVTLNDGSKATSDAGGPGFFVGLDDGTQGLEPRFSCNLLISDQKTAMGAIEDLARSFLAMMYYHNSSISVRVDRPYFFEDFNRTDQFDIDNEFSEVPPKHLKYPPVLVFNNLNVKDGIFAYADVDRSTKLSAVEVTYLDKRFNYTPRTEYVEDTESIKYVGLNYKAIDGIGVTSRSQARRLARHILFESMHTTETISFTAGFDGLLTEPGDIIRVDDEIRSFHKNFGIVLGTSGTADYKNPDGIYKDSPPSGIGPRSVIVSPAIMSDQTSYISGGVINIHNALGKTSIDAFYENPTSGNEFYRDINRPQIISLKIKPGGSGISWDPCDSGIAIHVDGLNDYLNGSGSSQWFAENSANINYGSAYSIDVSGIDQKYYRVLSTSEVAEGGIGITATIHHTGKFDYVEKGVNYDLNTDTFQPDLKITEISRPNEPSAVNFVSFSRQSNNKLDLNIRIYDPTSKIPQKYVIFLTEPGGKTIETEVSKGQGSNTLVTLDEESSIDQLGQYEVLVFSENTKPVNARSLLSKSLVFSTQLSDFNFTTNNSFFNYQNISLESNFFPSNYNDATRIGQGVNKYPRGTGEISTFESSFEDIFGGSGYEILNEISGQIINLRKIDGTLVKENFKTLKSQERFDITVKELNDAVQYTGIKRYQVPPNIDFEVNNFTLVGDLSAPQLVPFERSFSEPPVVFTTQETNFQPDGQTNYLNKIGRVSGQANGFMVTGVSDRDSNHTYIASKTGIFLLENALKRIEINYVRNSYQDDYKFVEFVEYFDAPPVVFLQSQEPDSDIEDFFSETCITGISTSGFYYKAFQADLEIASGTGILAYIAAAEETFNVLSSSYPGVKSINYNTIQDDNVLFDSTPILDFYGGPSYRFDYNDYSILCQRVEDYVGYDDIFFSVERHGTKNTVRQNALQTGLDYIAGLSVAENLSNDRVQFEAQVGTGNFSMLTWGTFQSDLGGKQSLINFPGKVSWFQSGDGKNYISFINKTYEYLAITGETTLNDDTPKMLQISMDREQAVMTTYLNGVENISADISDLRDGSVVTGLHLTGVGVALSGYYIDDDVTGFYLSGIGDAFNTFGNTNALSGDYTGFVTAGGRGGIYENVNFSGFRFEFSGDVAGTPQRWTMVDRDPGSPSYNKTGFIASFYWPYPWQAGDSWDLADATFGTPDIDYYSIQAPRNLNTFDGYYSGYYKPDTYAPVGKINVFENLTTTGLKLKVSYQPSSFRYSWVLTDDDPGSPSYYRTGWILLGNPIYPWDQEQPTYIWSRRPGTSLESTAPDFSGLYPYLPRSLDSTSSVCQLLNEPTSFWGVGPLYEGRMNKYAAIIKEKVETNYYNYPDGGFSDLSGNPEAEFVIGFKEFPNLIDSSNNILDGDINVIGSINRDVRNYTGTNVDFNFLQIGTSGDQNRLDQVSIGSHPLTDGYKLDFFVGGFDGIFESGEASFSVTFPDYGISSIQSLGANSIYAPTGPGLQYIAEFEIVENQVIFELNLEGDFNGSGAENIKEVAIYTGGTPDFSADYLESTNLVATNSVSVTGQDQTLEVFVLSEEIEIVPGIPNTGFLYYKALPKDYIKTGKISEAVAAQMFYGFPDTLTITESGQTTIARSNALDLAYAQSDEPVNIFADPVNLYIVNDIPLDWRAEFLIRNNGIVTVESSIPMRTSSNELTQINANKLQFPENSDLVDFEISCLLNANGQREAFIIN